jgi:hypothetical protein
MTEQDAEAKLIRKLRDENEKLRDQLERNRLGIQALCDELDKEFPRPIKMGRKGAKLVLARASLKEYVEELLAAYKREKGGIDFQRIVDLARPIEKHLRSAYDDLWKSQEKLTKVLGDSKLKHLELDLKAPREDIGDICSDMRITLLHEVHDELDNLEEVSRLCEGGRVE